MANLPERVVFRDWPTKTVEQTLVFLGIEVTGPDTCVLPVGWTIAGRDNVYSAEPHIFLNESKEEMARVLFDNSLIVSQAGIEHIVARCANVAADHVVDSVYEHAASGPSRSASGASPRRSGAMDRLRPNGLDEEPPVLRPVVPSRCDEASDNVTASSLGTKRKSPDPESKESKTSDAEIIDITADDEPETVVCPPGKRQKKNPLVTDIFGDSLENSVLVGPNKFNSAKEFMEAANTNERDDLALYQEFLMGVYEIGEGYYADPEPCPSCSKDSELKAKFEKAKEAITDCSNFIRQRVKESGGDPDECDSFL
jgi:hypothetical protein